MSTNSFLDNNYCLDKSVVLKNHIKIMLHSSLKEIPTDLGVQISKAKVTGEDSLQIYFHMITQVKMLKCFETYLIITHYSRKPLYDCGC